MHTMQLDGVPVPTTPRTLLLLITKQSPNSISPLIFILIAPACICDFSVAFHVSSRSRIFRSGSREAT